MSVPNSLAYRIEIQWMFEYFPTRGRAAIERAYFKVGAARYRSNDSIFDANSAVFNMQTDASGSHGEPVPGGVARMEIVVDDDGIFGIRLTASVGGAEGAMSMKAKSDSRIPFMLNVNAHDDEQAFQGTAISVHGTITTGKRQVDYVEVMKP